jgi:hypothetical protein
MLNYPSFEGLGCNEEKIPRTKREYLNKYKMDQVSLRRH